MCVYMHAACVLCWYCSYIYLVVNYCVLFRGHVQGVFGFYNIVLKYYIKVLYYVRCLECIEIFTIQISIEFDRHSCENRPFRQNRRVSGTVLKEEEDPEWRRSQRETCMDNVRALFFSGQANQVWQGGEEGDLPGVHPGYPQLQPARWRRWRCSAQLSPRYLRGQWCVWGQNDWGVW